MAIKNFKEISDRRGYLVSNEDRQIFEKEIKKSNFGKGQSDMIEFILYDSNDNQLPQGDEGKLVRYIDINDSNINEYFIKTNTNANNKTLNDSPEFLIDLQRLINDAGYSNGIFKTQVTLLNRRVGSEELQTDKMWIHEIAPSRTEIRVVPLKNTSSKDLIKRFNLFTEGGDFRDDTIYYANQFIENVDVNRILDEFLRLKGRIRDGKNYQKLIEKEFGVQIPNLFQKIKEEYINSMKYFISNRQWDIRRSNYGQTISNGKDIELSVNTIIKTSEACFLNAINKYLPKRNIQETNELSSDQQITLDRVKRILKSAQSNLTIKSTIPDKVGGIVRGCTDKNAENFNPLAKENDGSCKYKDEEIQAIVVKGCTDKSALNFNKYATKDDGSCQYPDPVIPDPIEPVDIDTDFVIDPPPPPPIQVVTKKYYIWSETGGIKYTDKNKRALKVEGVEYDSFSITHIKGKVSFKGDVREVPKIRPIPPKVYGYMIENVSHKTKKRTMLPRIKKIEKFSTIERRRMVRDDIMFDVPMGDFTSAPFKGTSASLKYKDKLGVPSTTSIIGVGERILVCAQENTIAQVPGFKITKLGNCGEVSLPPPPPPPPRKRGCTDRNAENFDKGAQIDDGSCRYKIIEIKPPPPPKPIDVIEEPELPDVSLSDIPRPLDLDIKKPIPRPTPTPPPPPRPNSGGRGSGGGGGGGGNPFTEDIIDIDRNDSSLGGGLVNPFTNRGDLVRLRKPNQNFK